MPLAKAKICCLFVSQFMKIRTQHVFKSKAAPKQGMLLLSDPHLTEEFFERAVVLIVNHQPNECFGLVLNHPSELILSDLFEHIELDLPIYCGGPVDKEQLFYLHRFANVTSATQVTDKLFFGGDWKEVVAQAKRVEHPQDYLRLFAGYAGWSSGQLEAELSAYSWVCTPDFKDVNLFKAKPQNLWKNCMLEQGPELALFAHFPIHIKDN